MHNLVKNNTIYEANTRSMAYYDNFTKICTQFCKNMQRLLRNRAYMKTYIEFIKPAYAQSIEIYKMY